MNQILSIISDIRVVIGIAVVVLILAVWLIVEKLRTKKCITLSEQLYDAYQLSKVNERAEIIAEWVKDGYTTGHTSEYIPVKIEEELVHGEKYTVVLERYEDHQMYARKVSD